MAGPLRRLRRRPSAALAGVWFVTLALLVAGPLLGRGHLILLDFPSGPALPRVSLFPLPSSGGPGNALPLNALHAFLRELWVLLPEKVFLLAPIVVGGLGLYRLVRVTFGIAPVAAALGGTLYVINPFVYDRYLSGHLHLLLAYALLPWAVVPLLRALREPTMRLALVVGLWLGVLAAVSIHIAGLYALLAVVIAVAALGRARARAGFVAAAWGLGALLSAYWLLPLFFAPEPRVGVADLAEYESRPDGFAVVPTLLSLYGFWREEFTRPAEAQPALYLLLVPILGLVVVGGARLLRSNRRLGLVLTVVGGLGVLLAAGTAFPPTAGVFDWLFTNAPFFGAYREPQKFLALTVLVYAVLAAAGLDWLWRSDRRLLAVAPIAVASVLLYGHAMFWGLSEVELSRYPSSWKAADEVMERRGEGRLLVLPWWLYEDWTFTGGRIVAGPAQSFFSGREVLGPDEPGFEDVPPASVDPFTYYVSDLLDQERIRDLGSQLAPLGVRYIAWTSEADPEDFQWLSAQADLASIYFGGDLALFENRAWQGDVLPLDRVQERPPYAESVRGGAPGFVGNAPGWKSIQSRGNAVSVAERCNDGWRLGDARARCHLGAVAAFETPNDAATLWRPFVAAQVVGYAITIATLALVVLRLLRRRTARAGGKPGPRIAQRAG